MSVERHSVLGDRRLPGALDYAQGSGRTHYEFDMLQHGPVFGLGMRPVKQEAGPKDIAPQLEEMGRTETLVCAGVLLGFFVASCGTTSRLDPVPQDGAA